MKAYIENLRKEDLEKHRARIRRHRSEPSELAKWGPPDDTVKFDDSCTDWKLVLQNKDQEFNELKMKMNDMQIYGDTMNKLLSNERLRVSRCEFQV